MIRLTFLLADAHLRAYNPNLNNRTGRRATLPAGYALIRGPDNPSFRALLKDDGPTSANALRWIEMVFLDWIGL